MKKIIITVIIILVIGTVVYLINGGYSNGTKASDKADIFKRTKFLMDTIWTIQIPVSENNFEQASELAFVRIEELDQKLNLINPKSPLYDFNNKGTPITDPEIIGIAKTALKVSEETGGAFDITVGPIVNLWGFLTENPHIPADKDIQEALKNVGYRHLILKDNQLTKDQGGVQIDFGGIKGYALGQAIDVLKRQGIQSALVQAGGQIQALGTYKGGPWKVGVRNPRGNGIIAGIGLESGMGIATSGDYERFFEKDGVRYHHILDPKTGYPARGVMSVSVITADPTLADAYTKIFVMGAEKALKFADSHPVINVIIVTSDGNIQYSKGLENTLIKE